MAFLPLPFPLPNTTISSHLQLSSRPTFCTRSSPSRDFTVSCNASNNAGEDMSSPGRKVERRNLLLGMGGLYGATNLVPSSLASPISTVQKCSGGTNLNNQQPLDVNCCPPPSDQIIDYKLPPVTKLRVRPAAHLVTKEYIARYERATELMKALPADDPRNFFNQANVHCAYCNLAYDQDVDPAKKLQIHFSWLFFPWHRWYLYFYERILAKLIDDPAFALPFWNWDNPPGMPMPAMFAKANSPLNNLKRNQAHLPLLSPRPPPSDLLFSKTASPDPSVIIPANLTEMYGEMVRNSVNLEDFYGARYIQGNDPSPGAGSVERGSHTAIHRWVGDPRSPAGEDMGNFYSTGRDPLFFCHHANVDRLWSIWRGIRGSRPKDFSDADWLDASFLLYDESAQLVRVRVKDTLEDVKMGYTFDKVELPWLDKRPKARNRQSKIAAKSTAPKANDASVFPVKLDGIIRVLVDRPKRRRSKKDKERAEELLVIEGIEVDSAKFVRFEVFVNDEDDKPGDVIDLAEYAGCYSQVPHKNSSSVKSKIRLGLTELLEDLDVEDDDQILVSLVPREGGGDVTIGGVKIIYV